MADANEINQLLAQGIAAAKAGQTESARTALTRAVELDQYNERAWLWLSGVVQSPEDRRICLENVLEINPNNTQAQAGLRWLDQNSPAVQEIEEHCPHCNGPVSSRDKTCPHCGKPLIVVCPDCGQGIEIIHAVCPHCHRSLGDFHAGFGYYLNLGEAYLLGGRIGQATDILAEVERFTTLNNSELDHLITFYLDLARYYRQRSKFDDARAIYGQALRRDPNNAALLMTSAQFEIETDGSKSIALEQLEQVLQLEPTRAEAHLWLGNLLLDRGDKSSAANHFLKVIEISEPRSPIGFEAHRRWIQLQPEGYAVRNSWPETARHMIGLMLSPMLAAVSNARLSLFNINLSSWIMLIVSTIGAWLWVSATDVPHNPLSVRLFGLAGLPAAHQWKFKLAGAVLWLATFILIVIKV